MGEEIKPSRISIFTRDGKKLANGVVRVKGLNIRRELPKKMDWKLPGDLSWECDLKLTENNKLEMEAIQELLFKDIEKRLSEFHEKVDKMIENIMRNYVTPPIKGEITKGKVRWRGLEVVWQKTEDYDAFVGIRQREWLIFPDGKKIHWSSLVNIEEE